MTEEEVGGIDVLGWNERSNMETIDFNQFPRTDFLFNDGGLPKTVVKRQLLTRDELASVLAGPLIVEEKCDGSNTGLSFDDDGVLRFQGKTRYLGSHTHPQHHMLFNWGWEIRDALWEALGPGRTVYGEWMYAKHTLRYDALPHWFVGFDVYERPTPEEPDGWFWTADARNELLSSLGIATVPRVCVGSFRTLEDLMAKAEGPSAFGAPTKEGIYLRLESGGRLSIRAKYVRPEFRKEHEESDRWSRTRVRETNGIST